MNAKTMRAQEAAMPATTLNTDPFKASHWSEPSGYGNWWFRNSATGDEVNHVGNYSEVKRLLPAGTWLVLP
ncbi:hypothetical protein [Nonomuraea angiospora]|uniref:hypothetical protein n=1 Tax=Nonomuraea angiospora TaxID=46172 RepID=UPI0029AABBA6|nr:hypothetical protein [Nonomuraea angiospora]MDX3100478.1 hypothetical protein [Nonomuraea angiospora]